MRHAPRKSAACLLRESGIDIRSNAIVAWTVVASGELRKILHDASGESATLLVWLQ
jgi:hypothetical protein